MSGCNVCHGQGWITNGSERFACPRPGCPYSRTPPFRVLLTVLLTALLTLLVTPRW